MCRLLESITRSNHQHAGHPDDLAVDDTFNEGSPDQRASESIGQTPLAAVHGNLLETINAHLHLVVVVVGLLFFLVWFTSDT